MARIVCFIDKEGMIGTCCEEAREKTIIDCDRCDFKKQSENKEKDEFSYCLWLGD